MSDVEGPIRDAAEPDDLVPLREPDLPRTAKMRPKALRTGWTTGTCASAAAKAAAQLLATGEAKGWVEVALPSGRRVTFAVDESTLEGDAARAVVIKDAGDDPDVTHGARLTATVRWLSTADILSPAVAATELSPAVAATELTPAVAATELPSVVAASELPSAVAASELPSAVAASELPPAVAATELDTALATEPGVAATELDTALATEPGVAATELDTALATEPGVAATELGTALATEPGVAAASGLGAAVGVRAQVRIGRVLLVGGEGVGVVTKPGLGLEVGGPAINPVPRSMISQAVAEVAGERGVEVVISVPDGERIARKTTNRRLGILGGISILGTTGIVRPFSTASWRASVMQAVQVAAAQGEQTIVLCTGGRTEAGAVALLPQLPEVCFVEVGDFTGAALRTAAERGMTRVVFVGMVGKLTKLASGVLMTHYTRSSVDVGILNDMEPRVDVSGANTARHAYELWERAGVLREAGDVLCQRVQSVLRRFSKLDAEVAMVDFTGKVVVAATKPEWVSC